ncbi:MAG: cytochrome P450 [Ardenticatenaceae bacterium]
MAVNYGHQSKPFRAPGPRGHFLLGSFSELKKEPVGSLLAWQREYGDVVRYRIGPRTLHAISHPQLVRDVFIEGKQIFHRRPQDRAPRGLRLVVGKGLLGSSGAFWLQQRRMIQPIFHRRRIATMAEKMTDAGERMLAGWAHYAPDEPVDIAKQMMGVTLDIICQTMFGANVMGRADEIERALRVLLRFAFHSIQTPFFLPLSWPTPRNREFKRAKNTLDEIIYGMINQRRASGERHDDLLDMLLYTRDEETGEGMDDEQVRDEVITIFGAGHETTANALTWTWYLLAQHPDISQQMRAEVSQVLAGRTPTLADLPNLPYTKQIVQEAMRLYPPAPIVARFVREDTTLNGYHVPANSIALVSIYNVHRHPDFWPEPEKFDPQRFAPEKSKGRHRQAYMPFGAGQHLCIGNHFALMEAHLLLAQMAQNYDLRLVPGHAIEKEVAITLRPRHGLLMTLHQVT